MVVACHTDASWLDPPPDAPSRPDASSPVADADTTGVGAGWRQVSLVPVDATLLETRVVHPDRSARIRIAHPQCPGDYPGRWSVGFTLENEYVAITATVWRAGPDCTDPEIVSRLITIKFLYPGSWKIVTEHGVVTVPVAAPPTTGGCGLAPPTACERDCDCAYPAVCLSGVGVQRCAAPCEYSRECLGDGRCGDEDGVSGVCRPGLAECDATIPCPDGFACEGGACAPTFTLSGATRHACDDDDDCDAPLRCVAHFVGGPDPWRKQCDVVCPTANNGWCDGAHTCSWFGTVDYNDGVCGWVGD
jgi:hypothetical protein